MNLRPPGSEPGALTRLGHVPGIGAGGVEPPASAFVVRCSIHLSYAPGLSRRQDSNLHPPGSKPGALPDCATPRRYAVVRDPPAALSHSDRQNVRTSLRGGHGRCHGRRGCGRSLDDDPRLPHGGGLLAHHRRVPTPRPGRSPRRERQKARAKRTHREQQTSAGLELERRPMDVACRVHDCLRVLVCTPRKRRRQAFDSRIFQVRR